MRAPTRLLAAVLTVSALVVGQLAFTTAVAPTPASAAPGQGSNFDCFGETTYAIQSGSGTTGARIFAVDTSTFGNASLTSTQITAQAATPAVAASGTTPAIPAMALQTSMNALGITRGGSAAYAVKSTATGSTNPVYRYDTATQKWREYQGTSTDEETYVGGAVDPSTGIYYYASYSANRVGRVYGFDTNSNTRIPGVIATITLPITNSGAGNGDFAFDLTGNLYMVEAIGTERKVARVNGPLPTTATSPVPNYVAATLSTATITGTPNGMSFNNYGKLFLENSAAPDTFLQGVNPNTNTVVNASKSMGLPDSRTAIDLGSCEYNPTVTGQVNVPVRAVGTDQFTVTTAGEGITSGNAASTSGNQSAIPRETSASTIGVTGTTYTVTQTGMPAQAAVPAQGGQPAVPAAPATNLANYTTTYKCVDTAVVAPAAERVIASGTGNVANFPFPAPATNFTGANVVCTFTNTPVAASLATTLAIQTVNGTAATSSTQVKAGDVVVYRSTTTNTGALAGTTVITQTAPANSTYTGAAAQGWTTTGATSTQTISVPAGGSTTTDFTVTLAAPLPANTTTVVDTITSSVGACATCSVSNPTAGMLDASQTVATVNGQTATSATELKAGDTIVYRDQVRNTGGSTASTVVSHTVPANTVFSGIPAQGWSCAAGAVAGTVCTHPVAVAPGATIGYFFSVTLADPLPAGTTSIVSTISSSVGTTSVPTVTNSIAGSLTTVKSIVSVNGNPATSATPVEAGDVVVYRDRVTNTGGSTATTTLTNIVPANTTYTGTGEGWSVSGAERTKSVTVAAGATVDSTYTVTVGALPAGTTTIVSTVASSVGTTAVPTVSNPTVAVLDTVKTILSVNGVAADATTPVKPGDVVVYNDRVTNTGGSTGTTTLTNIVPANTGYTGAGEGYTGTGGTRTKQVTVLSGASVDSAYTVTVGALPAGTTSITSTVSSSTGTTSVSSRSNPTVAVLDTVKTVVSVNGAAATSATPIAAGDVVVYRDTTTNTGGSDGTTTLSNIVPANSAYTGTGWALAGATRTQAVTVPASSSVAVDYQVTYGALNGAATVTSTVDSSNGGESVASVVNPTAAVLTIVKTISSVNGAPATAATQLKAGDTVVYLDTVSNTGGVAGTTTLSNIVPANTGYNSGSTWTASGQNYTKTVTVGANASLATPYTVVVGTLPADTAAITSTVSASVGTVTVPTVENPTVAQLDTVKTILTVNGAAATAATPLKQGDVVVYADTTTNRGGAAGTTVLTEIVPANTTATNTAALGWAASGAEYSQSVTVAPGTPVVTRYSVTVGALPDGTTSIASTVSSSAGGTSVATVSSPSVGRLDTVKSILTVNGDPATAATQVKAGDVVVYRDTVSNTGGTSATTVLTEILPANAAFTGTGWTASGADYTRSVTVAAGATQTVDYAVTLATPLPANTQTVTSTVASSVGTVSVPSAQNPTAAVLTTTTVISTVNGQPADATTPIAPGDVVVYLTTVANTGGSLGSTTVGDTVPAHTSHTGSGEGWTCAPGTAAGGECTQTVVVAAGNSVTKPFTVTVDSPLPAGTTTIGNTTTTTSGTGGGTIASPTVGSIDTVKTIVSVNGAPATATTQLKAGDVVVYRDRTVNTGGSTISTVLENSVPAGTSYTGTNEGWAPAGTGRAQSVSVPAGATVDTFYTLTVSSPLASGVASVTSTVASSAGTESVPSVENPTAAVLDVVKTIVSVNGAPATAATELKAGDVVVYRDTVTNTGGSQASTTLTETLPAGTAYTGTGEGWSVAGADREQSVSVAANSSTSVTYTVTVAIPLPAGVATIESSVATSVGTASAAAVSNPTVAQLDTVKTILTVNGAPATPATELKQGDVVVYADTTTNRGGSTGTTVLTQTVPANSTASNTAAEGWTASGATYTQSVTVAVGTPVQTLYTVTVGALPSGATTVASTVSSSAGTASASTVSNPTVGKLDTVKTIVSVNGTAASLSTPVKAGDVIVYRDTVTNTGGSPASTVLSEIVPTNSTYTGTGWTAAGAQYTLPVTVAAGASVPVDYAVTLATPLPANTQSITSTVASSAGGVSVPSVTSLTVAVLTTTTVISTVNGQPADATTPIGPGDVVVYTTVVANTGGSLGSTTVGATVPANTNYTGTGEGWTCAPGTDAASDCTKPVVVAAGGSSTTTFTVTVDSPLPAGVTTISLATTTTSGAGAGTIGNPTVGQIDTVKTLVSVNGIAATAATTVAAGDVLVYRDRTVNTGGSSITTLLVNTVPANTAYTGTGEGWTLVGGARTQSITLAAGATVDALYTVTVSSPLAAGVASVTSTVSSSTGTASVPTVVTGTTGVLDVVKTIVSVNGQAATDATELKAGDVVVYRDTVTNTGGTAASTTLTEGLPANTAYTGTGEGWTAAGDTRTQDVTVPGNSTVAVTYTVTVATPLPAGTTSIVSTVAASAGTVSTPTASNATVGSLDVVATIVSVNGAPATAATQLKAGDVVVYRDTVTNTGGSPATTTLTNSVPDNAGYTGTGEGWTADGDDDEQTVTVGSGASVSVDYTVTIDGPLAAGVETITLTVSSSTGSVSTPSVVNATVGVLDVVKTIVSVNGVPATAATLVGTGDVIVYRDTVTNTGGSAASTTLSETLPTNTSYTGTGEGWTVGGTQVVLVGAGESESVDYTVTVAAPLTAGVQSITSTVATSAGTASVPSVTSTTVAVITTTIAVVSVNGQPADATTPIGPGDVVVYGYTVTNTGGSTGSTTLGNTVPQNTTYTGIGEGWTCLVDATSATACEQPVTVGAGGTATVPFTVTVVSPLPTGTQTISNTGTSSNGGLTGGAATNPTVGHLDVVKTLVSVNGVPATSATQIGAGDVVVYRDTVTNSGGSAASTVLTEALPANSSYTGSGQGWSAAAPGGTRTQAVVVAADSSESVDYTVTIASPLPAGTLTVASTVASSVGSVSEPTVTNATVGTLSTTVVISTINGVPYAGTESVKPGDVLVYTITTVNGGGSPATTTLTDAVPANTSYTGVGEGWDADGQQSVTVPANTTATVTYTVTVDATLPAGTTTIGNSVTSSAGPCTDCSVSVPTVGVLTTRVAVTAVNGLSATDATPVRGGDRLGYTLRMVNSGGTAVSTTITTVIPPNATYIGIDENWVCPDGVAAGADCSIEVTVPADSTVTVPFSLKAVGPFAPSAKRIGMSVAASVGECVECAVANPLKVANLGVAITADRPSAAVGEKVTLSVTVTNLGPDDATEVELKDLLTGLGFDSAATATGSYDAATRTWAIGGLANGETAQLSIVATVVAAGWDADVIVSNGGEVDNELVNNEAAITGAPAGLAFTGVETTGLFGLSGALLLGGLLLMLARRRRQGGRHVLGA